MVKIKMLINLRSVASSGLAAFRFSVIAFILTTTLSGPVQAQSTTELKHEIDRLKQDLTDMQRYVYQGKDPEKIPDLSASGSSSEVTGQLQVQIQRLEQTLRKLNGRFEEVTHQISTMEGRLDRLITDVDYRLRTIEGQLSGTPTATAPTSNMQSDVIYPAPAATAGVVTGTTIVSSQGTLTTGQAPLVAEGGELAPGQQQLGQLTPEQMAAFANGTMSTQPQTLQPAPTQPMAPPPTLEAAPAPGGVSSTASAAPGSVAPAGTTPQEQYNNAIALLSMRDYDSAEVALRQFLDANGDDPLAGNAMYWMGETYYARQNYREATKIFAESYTKYPEGAKVTDSLLKLAMSLEAIDQVEVACTSYRTLLDEHKDARQRVLSIAEKAVTKLSCP